ncbi:hypothetical protein KP509_27G064100 [Ceratopteris richardii]|nr:hypothetical protein KP509_27G064100 [Ceratopteris richardii]
MATGISAGSLGLSSFVLATEPIGPSKRGAVGMSTFYFFSGGIMLLSGLALLTPSWRQLCIVSSIPSLVYGILVVFFLEESPRWYLVQGRVNDAMKVLASIARWNGKFIPEDITVTIEKEEDDIEGSIQHEQEDLQGESVPKLQNSQVTHHQASGTIFDVFRVHPTRIRMFIMTFIWLFVAVVYYGVSLNVSNLGTNLYLSVLLNALAEMPAFVLTAICLEKYGRKRVLIFALLLGAVCCLLGSLVPEHEENGVSNYHLTLSVQDFVLSKTVNGSVMRLVCGMVAIFAMAGAYNLLYIYTAELFPTVVRNAALGFTSQAAQIGAIVAPMVVVLGKLHGSIPFASFSVVSFLGGLIVFKLPETLHRPLYETFEGLQRSERIRN